MNNLIAYCKFLTVLFLIYLRTTKFKSSDKEYFVLDRTEGVFGLSLSFYASGMGLWILTWLAPLVASGLGLLLYCIYLVLSF